MELFVDRLIFLYVESFSCFVIAKFLQKTACADFDSVRQSVCHLFPYLLTIETRVLVIRRNHHVNHHAGYGNIQPQRKCKTCYFFMQFHLVCDASDECNQYKGNHQNGQ